MTKYAPRTSTAALKQAKADTGKAIYVDSCQAWVCTRLFGTGAVGDYDGDRAADAEDGWKKAKAKGHVVLAKDIKHYADIPAGVQLFWTGGSHDFGHTAISIGAGNMRMTGIPSSPKISVRDIGYVSRVWRNNLVFAGYAIVEGNGHTLTDPPPPDPRPKAGAPWFNIATFNMKAPSLTKSGAHKWSKRRAEQVDSIALLKADVLCVQEAGSGDDLAWLDEQLKRHGLTRVPKGGNWRHIYVSDKCKVYKSGSYELTPLYDKDTKEAAWAVLTIGNTRALVTSLHLESSSSKKADPIRVKQAQSLVKQAAATATECEVQETRIFHAGDTNSTGLVAAAMKKLGFVPADVNAWKTSNTAFATINNWINKLKGGHEDYIFVAFKRPVLSWTQRVNAFISDHNAVLATIAAVA